MTLASINERRLKCLGYLALRARARAFSDVDIAFKTSSCILMKMPEHVLQSYLARKDKCIADSFFLLLLLLFETSQRAHLGKTSPRYCIFFFFFFATDMSNCELVNTTCAVQILQKSHDLTNAVIFF